MKRRCKKHLQEKNVTGLRPEHKEHEIEENTKLSPNYTDVVASMIVLGGIRLDNLSPRKIKTKTRTPTTTDRINPSIMAIESIPTIS